MALREYLSETLKESFMGLFAIDQHGIENDKKFNKKISHLVIPKL
jgi:hypothetical protein